MNHNDVVSPRRSSQVPASTDELASFVVRLPAEQHQRLRELAETEDRSMASVVRLAIRQYLTAVDEAEDHAPQEAAV